MSNQPAAGPTLAEETIVDRKGDDIRDRQVPEALHFRRGARVERAGTAVTLDLPDKPFLRESKEDQAPSLEEALGRPSSDDDAAKD